MKIAYFGIPHLGGTYTVYRALRDGIGPLGVEVRWLGVGPQALKAVSDPLWAGELACGTVVGAEAKDEQEQAAAVIRHVREAGYDALLISAACGRVEGNIARYLEPEIRRLMLVHSITVGTYAGARVFRDHVHAAICVSPRIRADLVSKYGFSGERTHVVPSAIDIELFARTPRATEQDGPLRLISLGRLADIDKGIYWLPAIMDRLSGVAVTLTIAGDGPDREELQRRCAHLGDRVRFVGRVAPAEVPAVLAQHDVFVLPSRFEGLPLSLVEAMGAGCVPVASRIKGVTDFLIRDGFDGVLFPMGDVGAAAKAIAQLACDRDRLRQMSQAARAGVQGRFEVSAMAQGYYQVLTAVMNAPPRLPPPLPLNQWAYPRSVVSGVRTALPEGLKKWLRLWRERLA
jgi:glycosyltransferase involved in cell wall biosynthesis